MALQPGSIEKRTEAIDRNSTFLIYFVFLDMLVVVVFFVEDPENRILMNHSNFKELRTEQRANELEILILYTSPCSQIQLFE